MKNVNENQIEGERNVYKTRQEATIDLKRLKSSSLSERTDFIDISPTKLKLI